MLPSFFFTNNTRAPQGETLGLINPLSEYSCNYFFSSASSTGAIRYDALEIGVVPRMTSIENSRTRSGGNLGRSYGNTSNNSSTTGFGISSASVVTQSPWCFCLDALGSPTNWNSGWCKIRNITPLFRQSITAWYLLSHVMPKIISYPPMFIINMSVLNSLPQITTW